VTSQPLAHDESFNYWSRVVKELPVEVHGSLPGHPEPALTALLTEQPKPVLTALVDDAGGERVAGNADPRRVVLFINPSTDATPAQVCRNAAAPQSGPQTDDRARVYAVLCNGREPVAETQGTLPATGQSDGDVKKSVAAVEDSLFEALRPSGDQ
jgi:hypothetical protein